MRESLREAVEGFERDRAAGIIGEVSSMESPWGMAANRQKQCPHTNRTKIRSERIKKPVFGGPPEEYTVDTYRCDDCEAEFTQEHK